MSEASLSVPAFMGAACPAWEVEKNTGSRPRAKSFSSCIRCMRTDPTIPRHPTIPTFIVCSFFLVNLYNSSQVRDYRIADLFRIDQLLSILLLVNIPRPEALIEHFGHGSINCFSRVHHGKGKLEHHPGREDLG